MKRKIVTLALCLLTAASSSWSHGGEDHDHAEAPAVSATAEPAMARATTHTNSFELVAAMSTRDDKAPTLTLFVNRFASNEPLEGATIEVESGAFKATAKAVSAGVYEAAGQAFAKPGHYPLTVSIQAGDDADLLDLMLDTEAHQAAATAESASSTIAWWRRPTLGFGAALAAALLFIVGRHLLRRHTTQRVEQP